MDSKCCEEFFHLAIALRDEQRALQSISNLCETWDLNAPNHTALNSAKVWNITPLGFAAMNWMPSVVEEILKNDSPSNLLTFVPKNTENNSNLQNGLCFTPLMLALCPEMITWSNEKQCPVYSRKSSALIEDGIRTIQLLIKYHANISFYDLAMNSTVNYLFLNGQISDEFTLHALQEFFKAGLRISSKETFHFICEDAHAQFVAFNQEHDIIQKITMQDNK